MAQAMCFNTIAIQPAPQGPQNASAALARATDANVQPDRSSITEGAALTKPFAQGPPSALRTPEHCGTQRLIELPRHPEPQCVGWRHVRGQDGLHQKNLLRDLRSDLGLEQRAGGNLAH